MKKQSLHVVIFLLVTFFASQLKALEIRIIDQDGAPVENAVISTPSLSSQPTHEQPAVMDQINKQFSPHVLTINKGQWVDFPNSDNIRHHVYSFSAPKPFEMKMFKGSDSEPIQFDKPGIVVLGCNIHDQMVGYIYVAENEKTALTNSEGIASLTEVNEHFNVWHARLSNNNSKRIEINKHADDNKIQTVVLTLLPEKVTEATSNTFGSRKFGKKE